MAYEGLTFFALDSLKERSTNVVSLSRSRAETSDLNAELSTLKKEITTLKEALDLKDEELMAVKANHDSLTTRCAHLEARVAPLAVQRGDLIGDDATSSSRKSQGEEDEIVKQFSYIVWDCYKPGSEALKVN
ncbi:hypothetical protein ACOSQ4_016834 [Xanthoceras sorbifolium]